jgi:hypothetical protein
VCDAHDCPEQTQCNNVTNLLENRCHVLNVQKNSLSVEAQTRGLQPAVSLALPHQALQVFCLLTFVLSLTSIADTTNSQLNTVVPGKLSSQQT